MRTFYIFKIKNELRTIYDKKSINVYRLLNKINSSNKKEYRFAKKMYLKIVMPIDKKKIDNYLLMNHINDFYYTKTKNVHELVSTKEESKLIIHNTYLKLVTTNNISSFFKDISSVDEDLFVIDFKNKDYFYLSDLKVKLLAQ